MKYHLDVLPESPFGMHSTRELYEAPFRGTSLGRSFRDTFVKLPLGVLNKAPIGGVSK